MYPKASDYLRPVQRIATVCGTFPDETLFSPTACRVYNVYSVFLLLISAYSTPASMMVHFYNYNDIVCFTLVLSDIVILSFHTACIVMPIVLKTTYRKLFKRLEQVERTIHSLNVAQTQCPINFQLITWHLFCLLYTSRCV